MADAKLTTGTPVLSLIDHDPIRRGDVGHVAGACNDPAAVDASRRALIVFGSTSCNMLIDDHFMVLTAASVDHDLFPAYPVRTIVFEHHHVIFDAARSVCSSRALFNFASSFLNSDILPAQFTCTDGITRTGAVIRSMVQQRHSAAEAWQREQEAVRQAEAEAAARAAEERAAAEAEADAAARAAAERAAAQAEAAKRAAAAHAAQQAAQAEEAAQQAARAEEARRSAVRKCVTDAIGAVLALYPRRDQPKGARSAEAKQRRWAKLDAKRAAQRARTEQGTEADVAPAAATAEARAEAAERQVAELKHKLAASEARTKLANKRAKRDVGAAGKKALHAVRSQAKASKRKAIAAREWKVAAAFQKEARLEHAGKRPAGGPLHTADRKRRRLLEEGYRQLEGRSTADAGGKGASGTTTSGNSGAGGEGVGGGRGGSRKSGRVGGGKGGGGSSWGWGKGRGGWAHGARR